MQSCLQKLSALLCGSAKVQDGHVKLEWRASLTHVRAVTPRHLAMSRENVLFWNMPAPSSFQAVRMSVIHCVLDQV